VKRKKLRKNQENDFLKNQDKEDFVQNARAKRGYLLKTRNANNHQYEELVVLQFAREARAVEY